MLEDPEVPARCGLDVASGSRGEGGWGVLTYDPLERALLQFGDEEIAFGVAKRLLHAVVGEKPGQPSVIAIQRRVPDKKLAVAAFFLR